MELEVSIKINWTSQAWFFIPVNKDNKKQIIVRRTSWSTNSQIKDVVNNVNKVTK